MPSQTTLMPQWRNRSNGGRPEGGKDKDWSAPNLDTWVYVSPHRLTSLDLDWVGRLFFLCLRLREFPTESNVLLALSALVWSQDGRFLAANTAGGKLLRSVTAAHSAVMPRVFPHRRACTCTAGRLCRYMQLGTNLKARNMTLQSRGMIRQSRPLPGWRGLTFLRTRAVNVKSSR